MARVTVEDCLDNLENRFELVLVAAKRARQLAMGAQAHLEWENDKPTVMALREIADNYVDASVLNEEDIPGTEDEVESEEMAATMSSEAEAEVGALAAQAENGTAQAATTEAAPQQEQAAGGEVDVAAALAAALAADLGGNLGGGSSDDESTD